MRKFINGAGSDSTSAAVAAMAANPQPIIFTAVRIQPARWIDTINAYFGGSLTTSYFIKSYLLTDCPAAFNYTPIGKFNASTVRHKTIPCGIGVDFQDFEILWAPSTSDLILPANVADAFVNTPSIGVLQGAQIGYFDNAFLTVYKVLMPAYYDANTYGLCAIQAGCVNEVSIDGGEITFKVGSLLNQQNQQVPAQLIGPNSRFASFDPLAYSGVSTLSLSGGNSDAVRWDLFNAQTSPNPPYNQSASHLVASINTVSLSIRPPTGYFDGGFVVWLNGPLLGMRRPIAHSIYDSVNSNVIFNLAQPYPFDQTLYSSGYLFGFSFDAYALRNPQTTESSGTYNGFPYVPRPEDAA